MNLNLEAIAAVTERHVPLFGLAALRASGLAITAPMFAHYALPRSVRNWLMLSMVFALYPTMNIVMPEGIALPLVVAQELAIGILLGFVAGIVVLVGTYAGRLAGVQMGFGMASVVDPAQGEEGAQLDRLQSLVMLVVFISLGGHLVMIGALHKSYLLAPIGTPIAPVDLIDGFLTLMFGMFRSALEIAAPFLVTTMLVEVGLGILARSAPQINIMNVGFGVRILVGLFVIVVFLPAYVLIATHYVETIPGHLASLIQALGEK